MNPRHAVAAAAIATALLAAAPAAAAPTPSATDELALVTISDDITNAEAETVIDMVTAMNATHDEQTMAVIIDNQAASSATAHAEQTLAAHPAADAVLLINTETDETGVAFNDEVRAKVKDYDLADVRNKLADTTAADGPAVGMNTAVSTLYRHLDPESGAGTDTHGDEGPNQAVETIAAEDTATGDTAAPAGTAAGDTTSTTTRNIGIVVGFAAGLAAVAYLAHLIRSRKK